MPPLTTHQRIYRAVCRIPEGRVTTYGAVARLAGLPRQARLVGYALHAATEDVPWHRVVNARGEVSPRSEPQWARLQQQLLAAEGVEFGLGNRIDLRKYGWKVGGRERT